MKFSKKITISLATLIIIIGGFIITHITPAISVRTYLFTHGYSIGAFKVTIRANDGEYKMDKNILDNENAMIYSIDNYILLSKLTGNPISNFKVKKIKSLYFTQRWGEA